MSDFQFALLQIAILTVGIYMLVASIIISTAINKLAKTIKEENKDESDID